MSAQRRHRTSWRAWSLGVVWAAYVTVFAWIGWARLHRLARTFPPTTPGRYATTDRYLAPLGMAQPSDALRQALMIVPPPDGPLLVVGPSHPMFSIVYDSLSYLGWPRPVWSLVCDEPQTPTPQTQLPPDGTRLAGVLFAYQPPPADLAQAGISLGPFLTLVWAPTERSWRSYCLR